MILFLKRDDNWTIKNTQHKNHRVHFINIWSNFILSGLRSKQHLATLNWKINLDRDLFFPEKSTLQGEDLIREPMCAECKCFLKRRHTDPLSHSLAGIHISKISHGEIYMVQKSHNKWHLQNEMLYLSALRNPLLATICTFRSCSFWRSQMVKCQITSFWQPTRAFISLFIQSPRSIQLCYHCICYTAVACSLHCHLQPNAPIQPLLFSWPTEDVSGFDISGWKWQWGHSWLDMKSYWSGKHSWLWEEVRHLWSTWVY